MYSNGTDYLQVGNLKQNPLLKYSEISILLTLLYILMDILFIDCNTKTQWGHRMGTEQFPRFFFRNVNSNEYLP